MNNKLNKEVDFSFNLRTTAHVNFLLESLKLEDEIQLLFTAMIDTDIHACAIINEKELLCTSKAVFSDGGKSKIFQLNDLANLTKLTGKGKSKILVVEFNEDKLKIQTESLKDRDHLADELLKYTNK